MMRFGADLIEFNGSPNKALCGSMQAHIKGKFHKCIFLETH